MQHRSGEGCSAVRLRRRWESGRPVGQPQRGLLSGHPHNGFLEASLALSDCFLLILVSAQRVWQPLLWQPSMTKGWSTTRQGEQLMSLGHTLESGSLIIGQSLDRKGRRSKQWPTWWDTRWQILDWDICILWHKLLMYKMRHVWGSVSNEPL